MYQKTHQNIQEWYQTNGRHDLPWRNTTDAYKIWISEIMLQQTQVKTVLERFYFPFLEKFPTLKSLGDAHIDEVLKMWEGLGYYTRAKNLHKTAQSIRKLPSDVEALEKLFGIGKNTAHAIASFAFGQSVPIMEANVKRILCRVFKLTSPKPNELWEFAQELLDTKHSYEYNQALMDIGSMLCKPKEPKCKKCPLHNICQGQNSPTLYPTKIKRITPSKKENIVIYLYNDKLSLTQREGKFLHKLWGFEHQEVVPCACEYVGEVKHAYTHFKLTCKIFVYFERKATKNDYFSPQQIKKLAISKVDEKIVKRYLDTIPS